MELFAACEQGDVAAVRKIGLSPELLEYRNPDSGDTCLHVAVRNGPLELVRLLIASKADVNATNSNNETPLHVVMKADTMSMRNVMVIENLVKNGKAKLDIKNIDGKMPIDMLKEVISRGKGGAMPDELIKLLEPKPPESKIVERTDSMKKLLTLNIPDARKPVPYRECSPRTPPPSDDMTLQSARADSSEMAKLRAENEALRTELTRIRGVLSRLDPKKQLKNLYTRLIQLEAIESELKQID